MAGRGKSETRSVTEVDVKVNYAMYLTRVAIYRYILNIDHINEFKAQQQPKKRKSCQGNKLQYMNQRGTWGDFIYSA